MVYKERMVAPMLKKRMQMEPNLKVNRLLNVNRLPMYYGKIILKELNLVLASFPLMKKTNVVGDVLILIAMPASIIKNY